MLRGWEHITFLLGNCWCCWTTTQPFLGAGRAQVQEGAWELRCWVSREHLVAGNPGVLGSVFSLRLRHHMARTMMASQTVHDKGWVIRHVFRRFGHTRRAPEPRAMLLVVQRSVRDRLTQCRADLSTSLGMRAQAYALLPPPGNTGCHVGLLVTCFARSLWRWGG